MAGRQDGIPIAEAAALLGLSAEAVRKRLQRGTFHGYKDDDGGWFVLLGDLDDTLGRQDTVRTERQDDGRIPRPAVRPEADEPIEATYRVTPAEIEQAVSRTSAQYMGDLRTMLAEVGKVYESQLAAKDEALAAKEQVIASQGETIAELRRRAEVAEAAVARQGEVEEARRATALAVQTERQRRSGVRRSGAFMPATLDRLADELERQEAQSVPPPPRPTPWARLHAFLHRDD